MEIKRKFARVFSTLGKAIVLCGRIKGYFLDTGVFTHVDFPSASQTLATGINNRGQIVGICVESTGVTLHGFLGTK
jgi:hypothetical protein